ncbi:hypothetical protein SD77_1311 [Bacillus badius]|uniref:Ribose 5-phosphate isomerase B n=1 Tax=Bacillus badius TaxID=1455 RepID=A0ABR5ASC1_BACBA|nr:hypothetical protein SD78_3279 [Bacillus badius]KIL77638.1 hypothetical protein SD77_1311 [Bacillus badius]
MRPSLCVNTSLNKKYAKGESKPSGFDSPFFIALFAVDPCFLAFSLFAGIHI